MEVWSTDQGKLSPPSALLLTVILQSVFRLLKLEGGCLKSRERVQQRTTEVMELLDPREQAAMSVEPNSVVIIRGKQLQVTVEKFRLAVW